MRGTARESAEYQCTYSIKDDGTLEKCLFLIEFAEFFRLGLL
jgi:hypothetical protein